MNHTDEGLVPGASPDASIMLRHILASLIAGITTEVRQTDDAAEISVSVISMDTGLKFSFMLPSAAAAAASIQADIVMSDTSSNPAQNKVIKAYVDDKFWTGTAAEYALLADATDIICFLSDTNVIMFNGEPYSLSAHVHGNLTNEGAIGVLEGLVVMTGAGGVLQTITIDGLKELLGASSGMNLLHNAEFASPFNTKALTIYNTAGECLDRWNLLGGTLTVNNDYVTLSQAAINTAQLRQHLPAGSYDRLMGQTLALSVLLSEDQTVYEDNGVIDGIASTIASTGLTNGYSVRLVVDNVARTAYVEVYGGAMVAAINISRIKLEIGSTASIEDGVMDAALDWARLKLYALDGTIAPIVTDFVQFTAQALTEPQKARVRTNIGATPDATPTSGSAFPLQSGGAYTALAGKADLVGGVVPPAQAHCLIQEKTDSFTAGASEAEKTTLLKPATVPIVVTIPDDATYNYPIGTVLNFIQFGAAACSCSFAKMAAVNWKTVGDITTISAYGAPAQFMKIGANWWWGTCA